MDKYTIIDNQNVRIYDEEDFAKLRIAGRLAAEVLDYITPYVQVGISTLELDRLCHEFILANNAIPAPLDYRGYPKSTCISLNYVICHGIPSDKIILKDDDILNIDVTVIKDGYYGDTSRMFFAGTPPIKAKRLCDITFECLWAGINSVKPFATIGDIGYAISQIAHKAGYSIVEDFCGHGIGKSFHENPNIVHIGKAGHGMQIQEGMVFTIEPMINAGKKDTRILEDGWTAITRDKSLSAQFEHTIGVTKDGFEIFTLSPKNLDKPTFKI